MIQLPETFRTRMKNMLGEEEYQQFLASYEKPRHPGLRLNPLKLPASLTAEDAVQRESLRRFHLQPVPWAAPCGFYYTEGESDTERPGKSPLHEAGLYYIQEPSAMAVAALSGAKPGEKILDLCAAPGGKSTQLAGMLQESGLLVSNEINPGRAKILSQNIERMGVRNAIVTNEDSGRLAERFGAFFDRVIVDAPCSGEGMFRKEEQALAMWSPANVTMCAGRQKEILDHAAVMVKSGGTLVYSTCTFAPEEDEGSIAAFLAGHPEFELLDLPAKIGVGNMKAWGFETGRPDWLTVSGMEGGETGPEFTRQGQELSGSIRLWPHRLDGEGHYVAVLRKKGDYIPEEIPPERKKREKGALADSVRALQEFEKESLSVPVMTLLREQAGSFPALYGEELYLVPYAGQISLEGLHVLRPGLDVGKLVKGRFVPSHSMAMALRPADVQQFADYAADSREAAAWLHGESISCSSALKGWTLVTVEGVSMGWGKASGGVLKNHYPKGLRRPYV